jgi:predicted  nucleic acid-binding Zn-ribbon protein
MQLEFGNKNREYDSLRAEYDKLLQDNAGLADQLEQKEAECDAYRGNADDDKTTLEYMQKQMENLEKVVCELEEKNKRLTDLLNSQVYNKA